MVKQVESGTVLIIKGRTFELVWDDSDTDIIPCNQCALCNDLCGRSGSRTLVELCGVAQAEPRTYFRERKQESVSPSIPNQEILISALAEYQLICRQAGNTVRADEISKLMTQLTDGSGYDIVNKITLSVGRKNGKLVLSNGKSSEWKMTGVDEKTAIASLVYFTIFSRFDQLSCFSSDFKLDVSLCESIKDKSNDD